MGVAHFCLYPAQLVCKVLWGPLYPLPGLQHMVVDALHNMLEFVVGLGKLFIDRVLLKTLFG